MNRKYYIIFNKNLNNEICAHYMTVVSISICSGSRRHHKLESSMMRIMFQSLCICALLQRRTAVKIGTPRIRNMVNLATSAPSSSEIAADSNSDILLSGLSADKDISVKIVSCRELVQEAMIKQDLSSQAGTALAELMTCGLLMGAGLKNDENLQLNLVGDRGFGNIMVITDGELKARGTVKNGRFQQPSSSPLRMRDMLGDGQIQVVRSHPTWKFPTNGIVALRDTKISLNLALYMAESGKYFLPISPIHAQVDMYEWCCYVEHYRHVN